MFVKCFLIITKSPLNVWDLAPVTGRQETTYVCHVCPYNSNKTQLCGREFVRVYKPTQSLLNVLTRQKWKKSFRHFIDVATAPAPPAAAAAPSPPPPPQVQPPPPHPPPPQVPPTTAATTTKSIATGSCVVGGSRSGSCSSGDVALF